MGHPQIGSRTVKRHRLLVAICFVAIVVGIASATHADSFKRSFKKGLQTATEPDYGISPERPIQVGGTSDDAVTRKRRTHYLLSLRGPNGEPVIYKRRGSCCGFLGGPSPLYGGVLDVFEVSYDGLEEPIELYLDIYRKGRLFVPQGFSFTATTPGNWQELMHEN